MSPRVIVAEDDETNLELLSELLTKSGHEVLRASDGAQALAHLDKGPPDLMLLDVMMPVKSGLEVLSEARARGYSGPVVMLTALDAVDFTVDALEAGADDYVTKPYSPKLLLARVRARLRVPRETAPRPAAPRTMPPPVPMPTEALAIAPLDVQGIDAPGPAAPDRPGVVGSFLSRLKRVTTQKRPEKPLPELKAGTVLDGRYRIERVVGRGAFGLVYRARHVELEMDVAVKVLRSDVQAFPEGVDARERFRREAVRACRVRHENAVRVLDFGITAEHRPYLVMEFLVGPTLAARLEAGPLEGREAARLGAGLLAALGTAHHEGVVHQDVKASNVVLAEAPGGASQPKLIDFGAAAEVKDQPSELVLGTASHMAPERFATGGCDARGDVYASGVLLYHALTGRLPFQHDDVEVLARLHATEAPTPPSRLRPGLAPGWDEALAALLAKAPEARPTALEAAALLRSLG